MGMTAAEKAEVVPVLREVVRYLRDTSGETVFKGILHKTHAISCLADQIEQETAGEIAKSVRMALVRRKAREWLEQLPPEMQDMVMREVVDARDET